MTQRIACVLCRAEQGRRFRAVHLGVWLCARHWRLVVMGACDYIGYDSAILNLKELLQSERKL